MVDIPDHDNFKKWQTWLKRKWKSPKTRRNLILVAVLAISVVFGRDYLPYRVENRELNVRVQKLEEENTNLVSTNRLVSAERDKYFLALQPWQAIASSIYTNVPPSEQLAKLTDQFSSMSNILVQVLKSSDANFDIFVNGRIATNYLFRDKVFIGSEARPLTVWARNMAKVAIKDVRLSFFCELGETNIIAKGWEKPRHPIATSDGFAERVDKFVVVNTTTFDLVSPNGYFAPESIVFTNVSKLIIPVRIDVYASGSQLKTLQLDLIRMDNIE